jgi:hypothetical protein
MRRALLFVLALMVMVRAWMDWLSFDSPESAQRFATALKHAVTLCGGAKAPF